MSLDHSTVHTRWRSDPLAFQSPQRPPIAKPQPPAISGIAPPLTKEQRILRNLAYARTRSVHA